MNETRITSLRNAFFTGLLLVAPLVVTIWALRVIIGVVGGAISPLVTPYLPDPLAHLPNLVWDILNTGIVLGLVALLGYLSRLFLGRYFGAVAERFVQTIPGVGTFYNAVKQIVDTFGAGDRNQFNKVVLVPFPRPGAYTIGFLTNKERAEPSQYFAEEHWAVFVPTCPSPTNGFFMWVPRREVIELTMSVGEGMKVVISCGSVLPPWQAAGLAPALAATAAPAGRP